MWDRLYEELQKAVPEFWMCGGSTHGVLSPTCLFSLLADLTGIH